MSQANFDQSPGQPMQMAPGFQQQAPVEQKQRLNVYTVMLIVAAICFLIASILFYMELTKFGSYPWWKTNASQATGMLMNLVQTNLIR